MSSWFGGPASTPKHRSSTSEGAFVRKSSRSKGSPERYFVRTSSPGAQSTRSAGAYSSFSNLMGGNLFGGSTHRSGTSSYKRRPRDGFISRIMRQIKRYIRDLVDYARRNPLKVAMLVLPLVTGGALAGVLKAVGVSLPAGLAGVMGANKAASGMGAMGGGAGGGFGIEQAMGIAKMFM